MVEVHIFLQNNKMSRLCINSGITRLIKPKLQGFFILLCPLYESLNHCKIQKFDILRSETPS